MLSENKLKILNDFIESSENDELNEYLNNIKYRLNDIEDETLLLKILDIKNPELILIGGYDDFGYYMNLFGLSKTSTWWYSVHKTDYNIYKKQLSRIKKINNINKDVI